MDLALRHVRHMDMDRITFSFSFPWKAYSRARVWEECTRFARGFELSTPGNIDSTAWHLGPLSVSSVIGVVYILFRF
jgi:hypothetical protein